LRMVVSVWRHNEAIVCMDVTSLIHGVMARAESPGRIATRVPWGRLVLRTRRKGEIHQMSNGRLSLTTGGRPHDGLEPLIRASHIEPSKYLQLRYTRHHPALAGAAVAYADSCETGYFSASLCFSTPIQHQNYQSHQRVAESHYQPREPSGRSLTLTGSGCSPLWTMKGSGQGSRTLLNPVEEL
jgi:hypothetical protein